MKSYASRVVALGVWCFLALPATVALAAPSDTIRESVAVCNPNAPSQCIAPQTNGAIAVTEASSTDWNYAAAGSGIVNTTTAVTIKAAAGSGIRNYITSLQISTDTLGTTTELAIRDGAGGTVLWRGKLLTTALPTVSIPFESPLKGTANTLLEVVTLTASTGGVYVNAQGFTAP